MIIIKVLPDGLNFDKYEFSLYYFNQPPESVQSLSGNIPSNLTFADSIISFETSASELFYIALIYRIKTVSETSNITDVIIYPNPWIPNDNNEKNGSITSGIYIRNLNKNDAIYVYNFNAELVFNITIQSDSPDYYNWDCRGFNGKYLSSGVYYIVIRKTFKNIIKKFLVIR